MIIKEAVYVYKLVGGHKLAWHGRYHTHDTADYELHLFLEGSGKFLLNRSRYVIEGDELFITKPGEFHSILPDEVRRPISYYAVLFEPDANEDREVLSLIEGAAGPISVESRDHFLVEELYHLTRENAGEKQRSAGYLLLSLLFRWCGQAGVKNPGRTAAKSSAYVERALGLMRDSLRKKLNVEELAGKLGLSEEHFIRVFRQCLGITPFQYFTRLKIEAASSYLAESQLSVQLVADHFGFENPFHFSRIFKKCTGLSPIEYRRTFAVPGAAG